MMCMRCNLILSEEDSVCPKCGSTFFAVSRSRPSTNKRDETGRGAPRKKDTSFDWEGHSFVIRSFLLPKYLWLATVNELWVNGELVSTSGGPIFSSVERHRMRHRGKEVEIVLEIQTRIALTGGLNYECRVDGVVVSAGVLRSAYVWNQRK